MKYISRKVLSTIKCLVTYFGIALLFACSNEIPSDRPSPEKRCSGLSGQDLKKCIDGERLADQKEREFLASSKNFGSSNNTSGTIIDSEVFSSPIVFGLLSIALLIVYFIPTIIAINKNHKNKLSLFLLNLFGGITYIGWVGALVWATLKTQPED
jgi:hypothetical protein